MNLQELVLLDSRYQMKTYRRLPVAMVRGTGSVLEDSAGRKYIDMVAGVAVNSLGHGHPAVVGAICDQAKRLIQTSTRYHTEPAIRLAERLVRLAFPGKVFFANSGAEANECAIKIARKWGRVRRGGAYEIITARGSFHGRTLATVTATGQEKYSAPFLPLPVGFRHVPYADIDATKKATTDRTVAVMLEPMIGEGGMVPAPRPFLEAMRRWCDEQRLLLILDEIQTGVGRTGFWFAHQHYGIVPDLMTLAKGLAGGVPIGACIAAPHADVFEPGDHGSTFGGNPLACATALAVLQTIEDENLLAHVRRMGELLMAELRTIPGVREVRGMGLMCGLVFAEPVARAFELRCLEEGTLVNAINETTIRIVPPLVITADEIGRGVSAMRRATLAA